MPPKHSPNSPPAGPPPRLILTKGGAGDHQALYRARLLPPPKQLCYNTGRWMGIRFDSVRSDWVSHEIPHVWNGNAFRQDSERSWRLEGVTVVHHD